MSDYWTEKHYRVESIWESLRGETVDITWRNEEFKHVWKRFRVMDSDSEWVKLQGMDQKDNEYVGGPIVVRISDIEMAEIIE